ncbi:MAG TPA: hypothetical protein P5044_00475 [bacterium]|nr:hypothetical protein [bacterium]
MSYQIATLKHALDSGSTRAAFSKKISKGSFVKVGHGQYFNLNSNIPAEQVEFFVACRKFGENSVVAGLSALFYHGLIDQPPQQIWLIVPHEKRTNEKKYRLIRARKTYEYGIETNQYFRICDINRAIVESFRYSAKTGLRIAFTAVVRAVKEKKTTMPEILKMAKTLECENMVKKHIETILGMLEA